MQRLVVYGYSASTYVQTVRLVCGEKQIAYELQEVDLSSPSYRALHPFGKMPALQDDSFALYETLAISVYLDEAYPNQSLQPRDLRLKARMFQWMSAINSYFYEPMVRDCIHERFLKPAMGIPPDEEVIRDAMPMIESQLRLVDAEMQDHRFLVGDDLTLADLLFAPISIYLFKTPEVGPCITQLPNLKRWLRDLSRRRTVQAICSISPL
jgi:glutathione S-transferase